MSQPTVCVTSSPQLPTFIDTFRTHVHTYTHTFFFRLHSELVDMYKEDAARHREQQAQVERIQVSVRVV